MRAPTTYCRLHCMVVSAGQVFFCSRCSSYAYGGLSIPVWSLFGIFSPIFGSQLAWPIRSPALVRIKLIISERIKKKKCICLCVSPLRPDHINFLLAAQSSDDHFLLLMNVGKWAPREIGKIYKFVVRDFCYLFIVLIG